MAFLKPKGSVNNPDQPKGVTNEEQKVIEDRKKTKGDTKLLAGYRFDEAKQKIYFDMSYYEY